MKTASTFRPQASVSFPFFGFGLASFGVFLTWLMARPWVLLETPRSAAPLGVAHLAILGWLLTFVFGAAYQLIPVIAETRLWSRVLAYVHFVLHASAVPGMILAVLDGNFSAVARWGAVIAGGVFLGVTNLLLTASRRSRWSPDNIGLLFAIFWLTITVTLGVLLALARVGAVVDIAPDRLLRLHMTCGVVGFFLGTLIAVSFKLVPMFLLSAVRTHARAWLSVALLNAGVMLAVPALLGEYAWAIAAAACLVAAGVLAFLAEMAVLVVRRIRPLDWPLRTFFVGVVMLVPTVAVAIAGVLGRLDLAGAAFARSEFTVFSLGLLAMFTPCVLGMAGKIVPFLAWQWRYADQIGRARVPLVADLFDAGLLRLQFIGHAASAACVIVAVSTESTLWLRLGLAGLVVAVISVAANLVLLSRHIIHPRLAPLGGAPVAGPGAVRPPRAFPQAL